MAATSEHRPVNILVKGRIAVSHPKIVVPQLAAAALIAWLAPALNAQGPAADRFWPQWRGPYATGLSRSADPPLEWSETKNVRWKVEIPGRGSASPVVWGDRLFLLTAVPRRATAACCPRSTARPARH